MVNYLKWNSFIYENGQVSGIKVTDQISQCSYALKAKVVVNATGVFAEKIMLSLIHISEPTRPY